MKVAVVAVAAVALTGCARRMPPHATALDAQRSQMSMSELEQGRSLVIGKCGSRCHQPPMPSDQTAAEWPNALDEMSPRAGISVEQRRTIERYLVTMTTKR